MLSAFVTGALARFAIPGPDPMPAWLTISIGLAGSLVGLGVDSATGGHHPAAASFSAFGTAVLLDRALEQRRLEQERRRTGETPRDEDERDDSDDSRPPPPDKEDQSASGS